MSFNIFEIQSRGKTAFEQAKTMRAKDQKLPVHSLSLQEFPVHVRDIQYNNPYDFTREHRHDYFEVFFFENGGGSQLIDFIEIPVVAQSCYIVYPRQVHLLKRGPSASGRLVQFREEIVPSPQLKILLRQVSFGENPSVIFENQEDKISELGVLLNLLESASSKTSAYSNDITLLHLQAVLFKMLEQRTRGSAHQLTEEQKMLFEFQHLLDLQIHENHSVNKYAALLNTTEKKLSQVTRKYCDLSPLQVIHNRLLLEAKRLLLFESASHKEIAFQLGFDSPASFSQFIRNKTGSSPSELVSQLVNIHK